MHKRDGNSELVEKIQKLKRERNAVILAHNYQLPEVQDIADFLGDSLGLSQKASQTDAEIIVFCGVHFMAETAKILSPDKKVLIPEIKAGCQMADMITASELLKMKKEHPQAMVVAYVNTTAEVKAETDICCTSANAVGIVNSIPENKDIIFVPDKYLAHYVSAQTGRKLILWEGYCPVRVKILPGDIIEQKKQHPQAKVIVHPECTPEVIKLADDVLSTSGMCSYAKESESSEMIIGTEVGILYRLRKENPRKRFYPASELAVCPNMKSITLEKVLWALEDLQYEVKIPDNIRIRAKQAVERMLQVKEEKKMQEEIEKVLDEEVRPMLAMHGGDVKLIEVTNEAIVKVRLTGGCVACPAAQLTLVSVVENAIKSKLPEVKKVEAV